MTRTFRNTLAAAVAGASVFMSGAAMAANIDLVQDERGDVIFIEGELLDGDQEDFAKMVRSLDHAVVVFESPGGDLLPGLEIGLAIRDLGFDTVVMDGSECASACAIAWLGGENRAMGDNAYVGFHAAYIEVGHRTEETGAGNAIIGAYLNELGLSFDAIYALTSSPPDSMYWLTFADAAELGIDVDRFEVADLPDHNPDPVRPAKG